MFVIRKQRGFLSLYRSHLFFFSLEAGFEIYGFGVRRGVLKLIVELGFCFRVVCDGDFGFVDEGEVVKEGGSGGILAIVSTAGDSIDDAGLLDGVQVSILDSDAGKKSTRK